MKKNKVKREYCTVPCITWRKRWLYFILSLFFHVFYLRKCR